MTSKITKELRAHIWFVVIIYLCLGLSWILFSDSLVALIFSDDQIMKIQLYKGIFFILFTSALLFLILQRKNKSIKKLFITTNRNIKNFRDTFEQTAVGMAHLSVGGEWIRINKKLCNILGYQHQELMQIHVNDIVHPDDLEEGRKKDQKITDGRLEDYIMTKRYITKSGKAIFGRLTKTAIRDQNGEIKYLSMIIEDITRQKEAEKRLEKSLREKGRLLTEIHHRVKNNLAIISGLLELQVFNSKNKIVKRILKESLMRIKSMALIHESYYKSEALTKVSLHLYLKEFVKYVRRRFSSTKDDVTLEYSTEPILLNINQAISCGLLLNELLVNAYRNVLTKMKPGLISINIKQENEKLRLQVKDHGTGLPDSTNIQNSPPLDMTIIRPLIKQLNGTISICRDRGTTFTVIFHKEDKKGSASSLTNNSIL